MPRETDAAFVAIDEVQLAGDLERGHAFTDRLLNLRGSQETLLLGAATMRGIIEQLLPGVHVVTRPRMSVLAYAGQKKLTRLPQRSAIVAFSADEVYAVGELIRRQRGGAAVVLGALSPRTRNKQVEIYQNGDVDFLVATDAIGMGLNLDLDHVAFAANRKYDGYQYRELNAAELGQIAGRAGRHMRDGTFGVTARVDPFPDPLVEALETHRFEPVRTIQWRNDALDYSSLAALKASLDEPASIEGLTKAPPADDQVALEALSRDEDIADLARQQRRRAPAVGGLPAARLSKDRARSALRAGRPDLSFHRRWWRRSRRMDRRADPHGQRHRKAISTRCRRASRRSAPGPLSPTSRTGLPNRPSGAMKRRLSRIVCRTLCMSG